MVARNETKLRLDKKSSIFGAHDKMDVYFSDDPLIAAARSASPVRYTQGTISFIHKTVQEFVCSKAIVGAITDCFEAIELSPEILVENAFNLLNPPTHNASDKPSAGIESSRNSLKVAATMKHLFGKICTSPICALDLKSETVGIILRHS